MQRYLVFLIFVSFLFSGSAMADPKMTVQQAYAAMQSGDIVLVDIRRPEEWADSGIAKGAQAITMHDQDFVKNLDSLISANTGKKIALICRTGGRTTHVYNTLSQAGYSNLINVSEGMFGSEDGPGWIRAGLPVEPVK